MVLVLLVWMILTFGGFEGAALSYDFVICAFRFVGVIC